MKKQLLAVWLLFPAMMFAQGGEFRVTGKIGTLDAPAIAFLRYVVDGTMVKDSVPLSKGNFEFKGTVKGPVRATLIIQHENPVPGVAPRGVDALGIYLEKGTVKVNGKDSVKYAVTSGSRLNEDNQKMQNLLKPVNDKSTALNEKYRAMTPEQKKDKAAMAEIEKMSNEITDERKVILKKYISENPGSFVSLDALKTVAGSIPEYSDVAPLFASLSADVRNTPDGVLYAERLEKMKKTAIGARAPEFTQNDTSGIPVKLASFKGKYVLLDFWASWCGPCRAENPNVVKAFNKYKDKNFTIIGVSLDQPNAKEKWMKAIYADNLTWTHVSDLAYWKNEVAQQYAVNAIPQNFLLDPEGKIIAKNIRGEELETKLSAVLH